MKNLFYALLPLLILGLMACSSDDGGNSSTSAMIKLKANGTAWVANQSASIGQTQIADGWGLTVTGKGNDNAVFVAQFTLDSEIEPGVYVCGNHLVDGGAAFGPYGGITYISGSPSDVYLFTIEITEVQGNGSARKFRGRFHGSFAGPNPESGLEVTEGEFTSF